MRDCVHPDDAATALAEIGRRQQQVIDSATVPTWYWWVVATVMVAIGAAVDSRSHLVLAVTIPCAVVVLVALTGAMIFGVPGRARVVGNELLSSRGALAIVGYVWLIVGLTLGVGFALRAAGAPAPATIATALGGAAMVATGPFLSRWLRRTMLANRAGATK
jgi:FtsH-binding integral membrane protein